MIHLADDGTVVAELLRQADLLLRTSQPDLAAASAYWAEVVVEPLEEADLGTVAWLLRDIQANRRLPVSLRDRSRYWAAYLEGRLAS